MAYRKWRPSKAAMREFAKTMDEIEEFCREKGITQSSKGDSYYFTVNGINYRVSNHSVEASNSKAYDDMGNKVRELYHPNGREDGTVYIHSSKTRIREIYMDIVSGYSLDGKGRRVCV